MSRRYDAVLFDLLSGLLDSWSLWDDIAGSEQAGRAWRGAYLRETYRTGAYQPYLALVAEAAAEAGLPEALADELAARYCALKPWPEVGSVLGSLAAHVPLAVVTNCSEALGATAVACTGVDFQVVVTAERAGFYKPDPHPYRLALAELGLPPERCLFVAGSAFDLVGTERVGLPAFWHDRLGMAPPPEAPAPLARHRTLHPLVEIVLGDRAAPGGSGV